MNIQCVSDSSLLVSIINTNKYNFQSKDILNPRPISVPPEHSCCYAEPLIYNVHLYPHGWMKWIYIVCEISLLLVSIINTNKYNFEEKDIPNPRPNKCTSSTFMFVCGTTHIVNVHLYPYGRNEMNIHCISD